MQKIYYYFSIFFILFWAKVLPFNIIIGSRGLMFSWSSIMAPILGFYGGFWSVFVYLLPKSILAGPSLLGLLHRLPLLVSARAFITKNFFTSVIIPFSCMMLFIMHPEGNGAWYYSLYWLIPIFCYFLQDTVVTRALSATFIAHAIGSVIWLYAYNLSTEIWIGLLPIVFCERMLMMIAMVVLFYVVGYIKQYFYKKSAILYRMSV